MPRVKVFARDSRGFSLMEMVVVLAILSLLAALATPYARMSIKRGKEIELRETLRTVRTAIDQFHADMEGAINKKENKYVSENGYPLSLQILVDGIEKPAQVPAPMTMGLTRDPTLTRDSALARDSTLTRDATLARDSLENPRQAGGRQGAEKKKRRYLRALPRNPFAPADTPFEKQWTFVAYLRDAPRLASSSYGTTLAEAQKNKTDIYDLHAVTPDTALDGTRYAEW
jgi:general secretion pathway protein G